jgi:hypothetical protein
MNWKKLRSFTAALNPVQRRKKPEKNKIWNKFQRNK